MRKQKAIETLKVSLNDGKMPLKRSNCKIPTSLGLTRSQCAFPIEGVCSDIMGLTKLDWNSSTFYTRVPVTIGVSRKVGAVMAEMVASKGEPPNSYKFFM